MAGATLSLFDNFTSSVPETEGIKYAGSKLKLLPRIISLLDGLNVSSVLDGFSGTTRVAQAFAQLGYEVTAGDISEWSATFACCYLKNSNDVTYYRRLIEHLNAVKPVDGWFTEHYGGRDFNGSAVQPDGTKKPWQIKNTKKLDAVRDEIDRLNLSDNDKCVALTALILAMDKVDSTLGHYTSYLREWSPRSYNDMRLIPPKLFPVTRNHHVMQGDIFETLEKTAVDFAYLDPPYGSNNEKMPPSRLRYAAYYHLWTTIIKNDKPDVFGTTNRRKDTSDTIAASIFEEFRKDEDGRFIASKAIDRLIEKVNAKFVALSYSSGGRATAEDLNVTLGKHGKIIKTVIVDYKKNVMASMKWTNEWLREADETNREFIFLIEK